MTHQMKFVVKPPASTTTRTGSPCQRTAVPCCTVIALIGSPAARPYAKQALITPEKVATSSPFLRSNSLIDSLFCSFDISRSFETPAAPATAIPARQMAMPPRMISPECVLRTWLANSPRKIGGINVPNAAVYPSATAIPSDMPR